ncbi:restriction endonuclease subunit S [Veronia pacifica]|uniref:Type I restriction modification DNA specificity domain-containing protein n=1 Tax=Veronia pacifica TaxID=1080227 RepID=A0A1C3E8Z5_9GAMM|nr:restriction endonuclease subunit S [Veronia pacifica]ODA29710.1 hypothetical protein A8L45_21880 [Veronia pacifica]
MGSDWAHVTIEELASPEKSALATGPFGSSISSKFFQETGVPVIRGSNLSTLTSERMSDDGLVFVSEEKAREFKRSIVRDGDIIFTCWGTINQVGLIGKECQYSEYIISNKQMKLTIDSSKADSLFVYYYFSSPAKQHEILQNGIGAAVPGFNLGQLKKHSLKLPPLTYQKKVAGFLGCLDNKITLNRQINQTLEQMAQTLFKSWFVDFDPVIDNALDAGFFDQSRDLPVSLLQRVEQRKAVRASEGFQPLPSDIRQLFPSAFEESDLGWVPEGWAVKSCEEISERIGMGPFGSNIKVSTFVDTGIPVISGAHLKGLLLDDHNYNFITEEHAQKLKNSSVFRGDIVFTHAGNIGQVALIPRESDYEHYMISQRQFYMRPKTDSVKASYLLHYFHSHIGSHKLLSNASQTGVPSIARPSSHLKSITLVVPELAVQELFEKYIAQWQTKQVMIRNSSVSLSKLRDTLLPKLISGELRLDEAEKTFEEAIA